MNAAMIGKLGQLVSRADEIDRLLMQEQVTADIDAYRRLLKERAEILPVVDLFREYRHAERDLAAAQDMSADPDLREFAEDETRAARTRITHLEADLRRALLPRDPKDSRDLFLEIRAGTGGDESALFAGDLFRMYSRFAERRGWKVEVVSHSDSDLGGFKELVARISGEGAYAKLKFESGVHRVQRVPETETQGRIHTSACTIAILAEADDSGEITLNPSDLRIDTFRASGAGGQHINKTDSAVRVTHIPTGIVVECQDDRSQHKNKAQALSVLVARIRDQQERDQAARTAAERRSMIGTGDRSERIRTYNFPQGRVTDHRINLTLHKISQIMDGDLDELVAALAAEHQAEQLAALAEE